MIEIISVILICMIIFRKACGKEQQQLDKGAESAITSQRGRFCGVASHYLEIVQLVVWMVGAPPCIEWWEVVWDLLTLDDTFGCGSIASIVPQFTCFERLWPFSHEL